MSYGSGSSRVTIVVPNWNTEHFLSMCFTSLEEQTFRDFEVVLVDSGSTDGSLALMEREFPEVTLISLGENRGFSGAVNAGIMEAVLSGSDFVALLNNDTEQHPRWLEALVEAADVSPSVSMFSSKMLAFDDRSYIDGVGDELRLGGLPYRLGHRERDRGQFDERSFVFGACGGAAMYRTALFEEIGFFDEDFGSYCEDGDLSFRAQLAGHLCLYVPDSAVYHIGGGATGGKRSPTATRLGTRNSLNMLVKDLPTGVIPHVLPFFLAAQVTRLATAAATGVLRAHLRGIFEAARMFPLMLEKRREIQAGRKVPDSELRRRIRRSSIAATRSIVRRLRDRCTK